MSGHSQKVDSDGLSALIDEVDVAANSAVVSLAVYEQAPPPADKTDVCQDLQDLKTKLQAMIDAVNATMADLGCGA